jgi:hypothetical protein
MSVRKRGRPAIRIRSVIRHRQTIDPDASGQLIIQTLCHRILNGRDILIATGDEEVTCRRRLSKIATHGKPIPSEADADV